LRLGFRFSIRRMRPAFPVAIKASGGRAGFAAGAGFGRVAMN